MSIFSFSATVRWLICYALNVLLTATFLFQTCSQYAHSEWYDQLGGDAGPLADAIIDRIAHDSYVINITSINPEKDISMREVYGLDKSLRE